MDIIIQGKQGTYKTTRAESFTSAYKRRSIKWLDAYSKNLELDIVNHLYACNTDNIPPLLIFDELDKIKLVNIRYLLNSYRKNNPHLIIDAIYITCDDLNIT